MLTVATGEIGDPVAFFILMKSDNLLVQCGKRLSTLNFRLHIHPIPKPITEQIYG